MSVLQTLQSYLCEYQGMAMVLTDGTEASVGSYALAPSGNGRTSRDILGNRTYQNSYVFYAKEAAADEIDRKDTHDFLEAFSAWLEERSESGVLPVLPPGFKAISIEVSNAMLFEVEEDGTGLYQVQIQFIFQKLRS